MSMAIECAAVHKAFGGLEVLRGIDLRVARGTVHAVLGPNGAGKTTLINILSTLVAPDSGSVRVSGVDLRVDPGRVRRHIALTGQTAALDEVLTAGENLLMMGRLRGLRGRRARHRAAELLEEFGLSDAANRQVRTYSGGMRRRLDLALCLVVPTDIVFLDEPTTGLDPRSRRELWEVVDGLRANGTTVLLTTQYLEEADRLAEQVSIMGQGRIVAQGSPGELKRRIGQDLVELHDPAGAVLDSAPTDGSIAGMRRALDRLAGSGATGRVAVHGPSLDDVFFTLTSGGRS